MLQNLFKLVSAFNNGFGEQLNHLDGAFCRAGTAADAQSVVDAREVVIHLRRRALRSCSARKWYRDPSGQTTPASGAPRKGASTGSARRRAACPRLPSGTDAQRVASGNAATAAPHSTGFHAAPPAPRGPLRVPRPPWQATPSPINGAVSVASPAQAAGGPGFCSLSSTLSASGGGASERSCRRVAAQEGLGLSDPEGGRAGR